MSVAKLGIELIQSVDELHREVQIVYEQVVLPTWNNEQYHGLPDALYGYMMGVFARIDVVSAHWRGSTSSRGQTARMVDFMDTYFDNDREANSVAVQMFRHKLMHTAKPRSLRHPVSGINYRWLLHWWHHLPEEQHFTFQRSSDPKILNLGLLYLILDLRSALEEYCNDLRSSAALQQNYHSAKNELMSFQLREV